MKVVAILNQDAGALRSIDIATYVQTVENAFSTSGYEIETIVSSAGDVENQIQKAISDIKPDIVLAGGGDGTASTAARFCWKSNTALAVLPAGTMNLFARALKIPLGLEDAARALSNGKIQRIDVATANGRLLLHQYSVGLQARIVRMRSRLGYATKIGKIVASIRVALRLLRRPRLFDVILETNGGRRRERLSLLAVSNNVHGNGHLPFPDSLSENVLGIYIAGRMDAAAGTRLLADLATGRLRSNPDLTVSKATEVTLDFPAYRKRIHALLDGELVPLEQRVKIRSHPAALKVLAPVD